MGDRHTITVMRGDQTITIPNPGDRTVLQLLSEELASGVSAPCGGNGLCGKCLIRIIDGDAGKVHEDEKRLLTQEQLDRGYRLACRTMLSSEKDATIMLLNREETMAIVSSFAKPARKAKAYRQKSGAYGCAIDIGTTTVVVFLVDLDTGEIIDHRAEMNNQRLYGADVISRIQHASQQGALGRLQATIAGQLDAMIGDLLSSYGIVPSQMQKAVAVGNPTMIHLLVGADPSSIARAPFLCAFTEPQTRTGADVGWKSAPSAVLMLAGCVSAYVGSDITAGIYATGITQHSQPVLYIDVGTNGEIALWDGSTLYCCSSAAGPAFEGASISQGTGAIPGAVDRLWHASDTIAYSTIGNAEAIGICGSGIIDLVALLLESKVIDETGAMAKDAKGVSATGSQGSSFHIANTLSFTQRDVREVQLAKAAIAAGIDTLLTHSSLSVSQLSSVIIAGGFGSYINAKSALRIGLLPPVADSLITFAGNAAGRGAIAMLTEENAWDHVEQIRTQAVYVELSTSSLFQELFIEHIAFPRNET